MLSRHPQLLPYSQNQLPGRRSVGRYFALCRPLFLRYPSQVMSYTLLGLDIGSSSVKASLLEGESGRTIAHATSPKQEMEILSGRPGWAEQDPNVWWTHVVAAISEIKHAKPAELGRLKAIGIAYQMHGLVLLDSSGAPVRPAIIWCDSRAVAIGDSLFRDLGTATCSAQLGNSPGNFTASKLAWVKQNEPDVFARASHFMLPGDYIAFKLTGEIGTTPSALSEGILWDFRAGAPATFLLDHLGVSSSLLPKVGANCGIFANVSLAVANELGVSRDAVVSYRAGDQPNNAFALNVLKPGEVAANAGTSGVVYGVTEKLGTDSLSRVNNFLHVTSSPTSTRIGALMCVNGTGSFYRWLHATVAPDLRYEQMNDLAEASPVGARGVLALPYGNGAERTLENKIIGASLERLDLNRHTRGDIFRAATEGIVFALNYGLEIMRDMGLSPRLARAGLANMFQSPLFQKTFATVSGIPVELYSTDGAEGAARGAGLGAGLHDNLTAFVGLTKLLVVEPDVKVTGAVHEAYQNWKLALSRRLSSP